MTLELDINQKLTFINNPLFYETIGLLHETWANAIEKKAKKDQHKINCKQMCINVT